MSGRRCDGVLGSAQAEATAPVDKRRKLRIVLQLLFHRCVKVLPLVVNACCAAVLGAQCEAAATLEKLKARVETRTFY